MSDQARWPTWTAERKTAAVTMIFLGSVVAFVGLVVMGFSFSEFGALRSVHGIAEAIGPVLLGAMLIGLPASLPFYIVARRRGKPLWSWLGAGIWFTGGGFVVGNLFPNDINAVEALVLLGGLTVIAAALGWIGHRTLRRTRRKTLWSWVTALAWLTPGGLMVYLMFTSSMSVEVVVILGGLTVVGAALAWIRHRTLLRRDNRPIPLVDQ